jgi:hypothetical protein
MRCLNAVGDGLPNLLLGKPTVERYLAKAAIYAGRGAIAGFSRERGSFL